MWDAQTLALVAVIFTLAGLMKGLVGFGLPMVAVGLSAATIGLTQAIALMLVPAFATNVWQAATGGQFKILARRLAPYLVAAGVTIWLSTALLRTADPAVLTGGLGLLLILYAVITLLGARFPDPGPNERWLSPVLGLANGAVTGLTGVYVVVTGPYLQSLGMPRDTLIQALGIVFVTSTVMLALALSGRSLLPADLGLLSVAATAPAFVGVWFGQALRRRLSEAVFRRVFLSALAVLGVYLAVRAVIA